MTKSIVILGGSKLQLDLIFEAKKMYLDVHLFDGNSNCIGKKYANKFYNIDFSKKEEVLNIVKDIKPIAILTIATEVGNITSCYISEKLGLNSNSYETSLITTNKIKMKNYLQNPEEVFCKFKVLKNKEALNWEIFPCIVKPVDTSAGRGVSYVSCKEDISKAIDFAREYSSLDEVLIEKYIQGKQYSIETISSKGKHSVVTIVEEFITNPPIIIETQQLVPARISLEKEKKIKDFAIKVLDLYDIKYAASHIEIREDDSGKLFLVEIASRMGGWRSELIRLALGINYCELLINSVLNKDISFQKAYDKTSIVKMILNEEHLKEYKYYKENYDDFLISDLDEINISESKNLADSNGFYFVQIDKKEDVDLFIHKH